MEHNINLGANIDERPDIEKAQDHDSSEFASGIPIVWSERKKESWKRYKKRNQHTSLSCVAQSGAKMLGVENVIEEGQFIEFSAKSIYSKRYNKPGGGMNLQDMLSICSKPNVCLESQLPSQGFGETLMNEPYTVTEAMQEVAEKYQAGGYAFVQIDIDKVAAILDQGKAVELFFFFMHSEWWKEEPEIIDMKLGVAEERTARHGVVAVDYTLWKGKKALIIEDSAGNDSSIEGNGQRVITEDFFKIRCFGAGHLLFKKNEGIPEAEKPHFYFTKILTFGMMNNDDVRELQKVLQYEKFLPTHIDGKPLVLGNFLQMTAKALREWQLTHGFEDFRNEKDPRKIRCGSKTCQKLNELYSY